MGVNRLNPVQKATFKKNQKWEKMKDVQIIGFVQYQHSSVQLVLKMDRNAKLRATSGTMNIHRLNLKQLFQKMWKP